MSQNKLVLLCSSVQRFAEEFKAKGFPLHGLINNAGIFLPEHQITPDGFEVGTPFLQSGAASTRLLSCNTANNAYMTS
jgi:NAD(P)-dependent dehydrogenase (short-subunit alcohol dehydrogenase family)